MISKLFFKFLSIGILIRFLIVVISNYTSIEGNDIDAVAFFNRAVNFKWDNFDLFLTDSNIFVIFNYLIFSILGKSMLVGQFFCVIAWALSFYYLEEIIKKLNLPRNKVLLFYFLYCFSPASLFITSSFLRESYQLLLLNITLFHYLNYKENTRKVKYLFYILVLMLLLFLLHTAFIIIPFSFLIILIFDKNRKSSSIFRIYPLLLISFSIIFYYLTKLELVQTILEIDLLNSSSTYDSRANYVNYDAAINPFLRVIQYFFEPFPGRSFNIVDIVSYFENAFRFIVFFLIFKQLLRRRTNYTPSVFFGFLIIECFWALFTYNWGTSFRHHLPQLGLLLYSFFLLYESKNRNTILNKV